MQTCLHRNQRVPPQCHPYEIRPYPYLKLTYSPWKSPIFPGKCPQNGGFAWFAMAMLVSGREIKERLTLHHRPLIIKGKAHRSDLFTNGRGVSFRCHTSFLLFRVVRHPERNGLTSLASNRPGQKRWTCWRLKPILTPPGNEETWIPPEKD